MVLVRRVVIARFVGRISVLRVVACRRQPPPEVPEVSASKGEGRGRARDRAGQGRAGGITLEQEDVTAFGGGGGTHHVTARVRVLHGVEDVAQVPGRTVFVARRLHRQIEPSEQLRFDERLHLIVGEHNAGGGVGFGLHTLDRRHRMEVLQTAVVHVKHQII
jgi:hypothetical protein